MAYDKKVVLPTPGLPRNRMSTSGIGLPSITAGAMSDVFRAEAEGHHGASAVMSEGVIMICQWCSQDMNETGVRSFNLKL